MDNYNNTVPNTNQVLNNNIQPNVEQVQKNNTNEQNISSTNKENANSHDIIIDEDFQINLEVSKVKPVNLAQNKENVEESKQVELGSEQKGNITF